MMKKIRLYSRKAKSIGHPPGSLVYSGEKKMEKPRIRIFDFDESQLREEEFDHIEECFPLRDLPTVSWINVDGLHEVELIESLGKYFHIHPLVLEDIVHTDQRPKFEDLGDYLFIVMKMIYHTGDTDGMESEQISFLVGSNFVITFQERVGDVFEDVRDRIRKSRGRVRRMGADYLAYSLLDALVDRYFDVIEKAGDRIEAMEDEVMLNPAPSTLQRLYHIKRELLFLRRSIWPLREVVNGLTKGESSLIQEGTYPFIRDLYDHTIQIIDMLETMRDMNSGMFDMYLSSVSNRMNEVMKVLTIIATIFIPLTFIAGIYGMNFEFIPELKWRWGYFGVWGLMIAIFSGMIYYFRRKKWF